MIRAGDRIDAFLSLTRSHLAPEGGAAVLFLIAGQSFEEHIPVHEGGMRLRLSPEMTQTLIQALQNGDQIAIVVDDFEEVLDPRQFTGSFAKFLNGGRIFQNFFKGPIE